MNNVQTKVVEFRVNVFKQILKKVAELTIKSSEALDKALSNIDANTEKFQKGIANTFVQLPTYREEAWSLYQNRNNEAYIVQYVQNQAQKRAPFNK